jgi:hypothetical protein
MRREGIEKARVARSMRRIVRIGTGAGKPGNLERPTYKIA